MIPCGVFVFKPTSNRSGLQSGRSTCTGTARSHSSCSTVHAGLSHSHVWVGGIVLRFVLTSLVRLWVGSTCTLAAPFRTLDQVIVAALRLSHLECYCTHCRTFAGSRDVMQRHIWRDACQGLTISCTQQSHPQVRRLCQAVAGLRGYPTKFETWLNPHSSISLGVSANMSWYVMCDSGRRFVYVLGFLSSNGRWNSSPCRREDLSFATCRHFIASRGFVAQYL